MPLAGTFDVLDFGEVLGLLSRRSATGRLSVRTMSMHGTIWMAGGRATAAEVVTQTGADSKAKWQVQVEDLCFDALRSPKGSFEFHPEDEEATVRAGSSVTLDEVVEAGRHRLQMWEEVESVIHSFEAVPRMADSIGESVELSQDGWAILVAVDGRHNVASLAKRLGRDLLEFCQELKPLIECGAVVLDQPDGWMKSLPKVRLEIASHDGEVFVDSALLDEDPFSSGVVAVGGLPGSPGSAQGQGAAGAPGSPPADDPLSLPPADGSDLSPPAEAPRRRLLGRSRSRAAGTRLAG